MLQSSQEKGSRLNTSWHHLPVQLSLSLLFPSSHFPAPESTPQLTTHTRIPLSGSSPVVCVQMEKERALVCPHMDACTRGRYHFAFSASPGGEVGVLASPQEGAQSGQRGDSGAGPDLHLGLPLQKPSATSCPAERPEARAFPSCF